MADRSTFLGRLGSITQIVFAGLVAGVAALVAEPGFVPRGAVLFTVFALPGAVGLIGTAARRPALVAAAGLCSAVGSFIAFSGVTLIFLVPAALLLAGALRLAGRAAPESGEGVRSGLARLMLSAAAVPLLLGAGASGLLITDQGCWNVYETGPGRRIELTPFSTGEVAVPAGAVSTGCSTGLISARGVGLGALLGSLSLGAAIVVARRRDLPPEGQDGSPVQA